MCVCVSSDLHFRSISTQTLTNHLKSLDMKGSLDTHFKFSNSHPFTPCQSLDSPRNITVPLMAKVRSLSFKVSTCWPNHAPCVVQRQKGSNGFVVGCASWGLVTELVKELEAEMIPQHDEKKGRGGMGRFRHKCGEREGVLELLECLEKEAIMGEDVGKEPMDYNRRAQIFDRSSQVFQALKENKGDVFA